MFEHITADITVPYYRRRCKADERTTREEALKIGFGIHHAGLQKEFKQIVEKKFRAQQLKAVIATGSI